MPERRRAGRWLLVTGAVVLPLLLVVFASRLSVTYATRLTGCVHDHGTGGALGLARWAARLGYAVRPLEVPVWEAAAALERPSGNCVVTMGNGPWSPTADEFDAASWQALRGWLARGNTLLIVTIAPRALPEPIRLEIMDPALAIADSEALPWTLWEPTVATDPPSGVALVHAGGTLSVSADGPRARPVEAGDAPSMALAGDLRGSVLLRIPVGAGAAYLLLDDFAWTNAGLDRGENARVLAAVLAREVRGGALAFDEYRHGHGRGLSFLTYLLSVPGVAAALGFAALWALFYLYGRNVRLQPAEPLLVEERRTAREYIDAVAQLHERARAAPLAVEAVARRLRHLGRGPVGLTDDAVELLRRAEQLVREGERPADPVAARKLVAAMVRIRKELYGSHPIS